MVQKLENLNKSLYTSESGRYPSVYYADLRAHELCVLK